MASRDHQRTTADLRMVSAGGGDSAEGKAGEIVEYNKSSGGVVLREDQEDIEVKLRRIMELVPVRVSNTSGSSAGSGSGDFHQEEQPEVEIHLASSKEPSSELLAPLGLSSNYRQMRRKEQDRLTRMDSDYQRRKEIAEFNMRREERLKAAEDRTAKKRLKRQKKKQKKKEKKARTDGKVGENHKEEEQEESDNSNGGEE